MSDINFITFIILALATYRVTRFLTTDHLFNGPREKIFNRFNPSESKIGYLFTCEWCMSIWVGLGFVFWYTISEEITCFFAIAFALSAVASLLSAYENK
jgi:hypothetical protein